MSTLSLVSLAWIAVAVVTAVVLARVSAPYGRHMRGGWGPTINHRVGWVAMELVSPLALLVAAVSKGVGTWQAALLLSLWFLHYVHRAVIYPLRARWSGRRMPVLVAASAVFFNAVNGTLNGLGLSGAEPGAWTLGVGIALFLAGAAINLHSDEILLRLRHHGDADYSIPRGSLFEYVSCPNYLGEIIQWTGFAVAAWNLPALSFAIWTAANLGPRAIAHHRWYHETFDRYPTGRRALIPGVL